MLCSGMVVATEPTGMCLCNYWAAAGGRDKAEKNAVFVVGLGCGYCHQIRWAGMLYWKSFRTLSIYGIAFIKLFKI